MVTSIPVRRGSSGTSSRRPTISRGIALSEPTAVCRGAPRSWRDCSKRACPCAASESISGKHACLAICSSASSVGITLLPFVHARHETGKSAYPRSRLPSGVVAALGLVLIGAGGILIGTSITAQPHYVAAVLPGWLVIGLGAGFSFPTIYSAATVDVEPRQAATASAVIQMARQIGAVLGVAALVLVLGASTLSGNSIHQVAHAWWLAGAFAAVAALAAIGISSTKGGHYSATSSGRADGAVAE
jgi:MFS family permease